MRSAVGLALGTDYLIVVELISLLLLAAVVGALVLVRPRPEAEDEGGSQA